MPLLCLLLAGCVWGAEVSARALYERGRQAEKAGHMVQAYVLYSEAAAKEPTNQIYWLRSQAVKSRAALEGKISPQIDLDAAAAESRGELPPQLPDATAKDRMDAAQRQPPSGVAGSGGLRDFDLHGDSKKVYEDVAHAFGLDCVFDGDYVPMPSLRFQLREVNYRDALHGLELATDTFIVPLSGKLFLVVKDTPQKRQEQDPVAVVSIPVPPTSSPQNFNALVTAVQQAMSIQKVAFDTHNNMVIFRDRYSKILPAIALLNDFSKPLPQVMIEMKVVEVSRNDTLTYGVDFPTLFSLQPLTTAFENQIRVQSGISGLLSFGAGKTLIGIGIMSAAAVAQMSDSRGKVLLASELRGMDNQPATMHIGDRYPVLTSSYLGNTPTGSTPGTTTTGTTGTTGTGTTGTATATGAGTLALSQSSFNWTYNSNGDQPPSESVTITSTAGTIDFTATVESSSPWLSVNNLQTTAGTLPATLTIAPGYALTALGAGSYQGTIQVSGSDGSVAYITVTLTVSGGASGLVLSPASISLASASGGYEVQQAVTVTSSTSGTLSATVVGPGLSLSIANTTVTAGTPGTVIVYGNPTGLSAQEYQGILSVTVGSATQEIPVSFLVTASGSLQLSQSAIPWTYSTGGSLPLNTNVTISSTSGNVTVTATAASANSWLLVNGTTSVSSPVPTTITISAASSITELATGSYTGTIQLKGSDGSLAYINVNLTVNGGTASGLVVAPNPISLSAELGGTTIQQTVTVVSSTAGTLTATVTGSGLSVSVPTTTVDAETPVTFTLQADPANLAANTYIGSLIVSVGDVTQTVQVTLSVGAINSGTNGTTAYTPIPSFNFEDLGLTLKVTPSIHNDNSATLDIDLQYRVLTGQSVDGVPVISQRAMKSAATVSNGEWAVIGGLLDTQEARNIAGLAGLARLPGLGPLVSTHEHDTNKDEVLILMRPVLLTAPDQSEPHTYATGSDTKPRTPLY